MKEEGLTLTPGKGKGAEEGKCIRCLRGREGKGKREKRNEGKQTKERDKGDKKGRSCGREGMVDKGVEKA